MFKIKEIKVCRNKGFVVGPDGHRFTAFKMVTEYIFEYVKKNYCMSKKEILEIDLPGGNNSDVNPYYKEKNSNGFKCESCGKILLKENGIQCKCGCVNKLRSIINWIKRKVAF